MDVREREEPGRARCPYCHDLLPEDSERVECGGCGTRHHAGCLEELGRCTVLGCAWTPGGRPPPAATLRPVEQVRRDIEERLRRRAVEYRARRAEACPERTPAPPTIEPLTWEQEELRQQLARDLAAAALRQRLVTAGLVVLVLVLAVFVGGVLPLLR